MSLLRPTGPTGPKDDDPRGIRQLADLLLAGAREHVEITVPRTEIAGRLRLLSRAELGGVKVAVREHFKELKLPHHPAGLAAEGMFEEWNAEMAVQILAIAVRDPEDEAKPLSIVEEWRDCDDDQIAALWNRYQDLQDRLDPMGAGVPLSDEDQAKIESDAKKGEASLLMRFGSRRLALFAITSVARLQS